MLEWSWRLPLAGEKLVFRAGLPPFYLTDFAYRRAK